MVSPSDNRSLVFSSQVFCLPKLALCILFAQYHSLITREHFGLTMACRDRLQLGTYCRQCHESTLKVDTRVVRNVRIEIQRTRSIPVTTWFLTA